jgi:hypothetical protein
MHVFFLLSSSLSCRMYNEFDLIKYDPILIPKISILTLK